jgi:hypothetical protein
MPKWSEVPWGTVITGVIAVYGAALGTFNLLLQRGRDRLAASEIRRRQAEQVTGWLVPYEGEGPPDEYGRLFLGLRLQNGSNQLVYQLIASLISTQGAFRETAVGDPGFEFRSFVGIIPPGETKTRIEYSGRGMMLRFGIELAFQDVGGRYWLRRGDGALQEVDQPPLALYGINPPVPWQHQ